MAIMGVYEIENLVNGKTYIGSSNDIASRWVKHRSLLNSGVHSNLHFQAAWKKYGESAWVFRVIEQVDSESDLLAHEQEFLDLLRPEYNMALVAGAPMRGRKASEATRKAAGATGKNNKGRQHTRSIYEAGSPRSRKSAKLTQEIVAQIRAEHVPHDPKESARGKRSETSIHGLARKYGLTPETVHGIIHGRYWKRE